MPPAPDRPLVAYYDPDLPAEMTRHLMQDAMRFNIELKKRRVKTPREEVTIGDNLTSHLDVMSAGLAEIGAEYNPATGMFTPWRREFTWAWKPSAA